MDIKLTGIVGIYVRVEVAIGIIEDIVGDVVEYISHGYHSEIQWVI